MQVYMGHVRTIYGLCKIVCKVVGLGVPSTWRSKVLATGLISYNCELTKSTWPPAELDIATVMGPVFLGGPGSI